MSQKIRNAIRECLSRCRSRADVTAFSEQLRGKPGWTCREIRTFTARVLRLFHRSLLNQQRTDPHLPFAPGAFPPTEFRPGNGPGML